MPTMQLVFESPAEEARWIKEKDEEGRRRGFMECPKCTHSVLSRAFHHVVYDSGEVSVSVTKDAPDKSPLFVNGHKSQSFMCEECWKDATIEERVEFFVQMAKKRQTGVKSPLLTKNGTQYVAHGADSKRYKEDLAAIETENQKIVEAIRRGE